MSVEVLRIPGGLRVDGLELRGGKCGCTSIAKCCYSWSKVKKKGEDLIEFTAKMTAPDTSEEFSWGYAVRKDGLTVTVSVEDARDKTIYSGFFPPAIRQWEARGWEVTDKRAARQDGALWRCSTCKWLYKEESEGIPFEKLSGGWRCPECNAPKEAFEKIC